MYHVFYCEEDELETAETLENLVEQFQTLFSTYHINKWTSKVLRKTKKKFKTDKERLVHATSQLSHAIAALHILSMVQTHERVSEVSTVLWVDDSPNNNLNEREKAKDTDGIEFELATSTAEALEWLSSNRDMVEASDSSRFRIVTDWYRPDEKDEAAESLVQQVRAMGLDNVPILIYCSEATNPYPLVSRFDNIAAASSDDLLALYWASMKMTAASTNPVQKGAKRGSGAAKKVTAAKKATATAKNAATMDSDDEAFEEEDVPAPKKTAAKAKSASAAKKAAKSTAPVKEVEEPLAEIVEEPKKSVKSNSAPTAASKKVSEESEISAEEKSVAPKVAPTASKIVKTTETKKKGAKIVFDSDDDEEEVIPISKVAEKPAAKVAAPVSAKTGSRLVIDVGEEDDEVEPEHKNAMERFEMDLEIPSTVEVVESKESDFEHNASSKDDEEEEIEATQPSEEVSRPSLSKAPTDVVDLSSTPHKSSIHDVLASRIPKDFDSDPEDVEAEPPKKAKKSGSKKSGSKQLFGMEDSDEDFLDDGAKMDVDDESFEGDSDEEDMSKSKKKAKSTSSAAKKASKSSLSRQPTTEIGESPVVGKTPTKKDWNSFLMSRVPSAAPPDSPLSVLDESGASTNDHLVMTPPPSAQKQKASKKMVVSSNSDLTMSAAASNGSKKAHTVVGVKSPPKTPDTAHTPAGGPTPNISPVEKPAPPKPTAPMGPTPVRSLSALDDDYEEEDAEDELPLFTKPGQTDELRSSSNVKETPLDPSKSALNDLPSRLFVGKLASTTIQARDSFGSLAKNAVGAKVDVVFKTGGNAHVFDSYVVDNKNGTYTAHFFPTRIGTYRVVVQMEGKHIQGSPFSVDIVASFDKKRSSTSDSIFNIESDDSEEMAPKAAKKFKRVESSLPEDDEIEGDGDEEIEATQVV